MFSLEIEIPSTRICVSSLSVWECVKINGMTTGGEITPDLYIHPHQAMAAFAFCFFGSLLVTVSTYSLYPSKGGWLRPLREQNNNSRKKSSNDSSYCSFAVVCRLLPLEWAVKCGAYQHFWKIYGQSEERERKRGLSAIVCDICVNSCCHFAAL